jgi:hypothetical protein
MSPGYRSPVRIALARFGMEGRACRRCYFRLVYRDVHGQPLEPERLARRPPKPKIKKTRELLPCVVCGDPGGGAPKGARRPSRHNLKRFGIEGLGCQRCYVRLKFRERAGLTVDPLILLRPRRGRTPVLRALFAPETTESG